MPRWLPSDAEYAALKKRIEATVPANLQDNALFHALYHHKTGLYPRRGAKNEWRKEDDGTWTRLKKNLSRREWIEQFFPVRATSGEIVKLILNPTQRKLECTILRMQRAGVPVRVILLKARKMGCSTFAQAVMFETELRGEHVRGTIVADNADRSKLLLQIASIARSHMEKAVDDGRSIPWDFRLTSKATYSLVWDKPIYGEIMITSAETDNPGRGGTPSIVHLSETAFWQNAEGAQASVMSGLPSLPGTMAFDESTANGDQGKFRDDFWRAWKARHEPLLDRTEPWQAMFFAWFEDPNYHWTRSYGLGRTLPDKLTREIEQTLTKEEKWLLGQTYNRRWEPTDVWAEKVTWDREELVLQGSGAKTKIVGLKRVDCGGRLRWVRIGIGPQRVGLDQLAWRRAKIADKEIAGDMDLFNREFPSRPEVAFLASGRPVFDQEKLGEMLVKAETVEPIFRGYLVEAINGDDSAEP